MPSQTCSREPIGRSLNRSRWMRVSVFALVCLAGSLLWWNDARTADITQENRGFNRVTGSSVEPAQYVPGEIIVKFHDSASQDHDRGGACAGRRADNQVLCRGSG